MNKTLFIVLLWLLTATVSAQEEPPVEEVVEEEWDWTSTNGIITLVVMCLAFCTLCVGGLCYMCARREVNPLKAQIIMADAKARARRDVKEKSV